MRPQARGSRQRNDSVEIRLYFEVSKLQNTVVPMGSLDSRYETTEMQKDFNKLSIVQKFEAGHKARVVSNNAKSIVVEQFSAED